MSSDYKKAGKKKVEGKKTPVVVYKKTGSSKLYVMRKGRMMSYVNYKKMCAKKLMAKVDNKVSKVHKVRKVRKVRKVHKGGDCGGNHKEGFSEQDVNEDVNEDGGSQETMTNDVKEVSTGGKLQKQRKSLRQRQRLRLRLRQRGGEGDITEMMSEEKNLENTGNGLLGGARNNNCRCSSRTNQSLKKRRSRSRSRRTHK